MLVLTLLLFKPSRAFGQTITFDDLSDSGIGTVIANGYQGLNWSNFYVLNTSLFYEEYVTNGYTNGTVSAPNVAFNGAGAAAAFSGSNFTFNSADFTGAWNNGLTITVTGYEGGSPVDSATFVVDTIGPTLEVFDWSGIDEVSFSSAGGTSAGYHGVGTQFAMDNLVINTATTPEPTSFFLMGSGLLAMCGILRRRSSVRRV